MRAYPCNGSRHSISRKNPPRVTKSLKDDDVPVSPEVPGPVRWTDVSWHPSRLNSPKDLSSLKDDKTFYCRVPGSFRTDLSIAASMITGASPERIKVVGQASSQDPKFVVHSAGDENCPSVASDASALRTL